MAFPVEVTILPSKWAPEALAEVVPSYRAFRLFALKSAPKAFARTYEEVVLLPDESWAQRATNADAVHFIATRAGEGEAGEAWRRAWLGSLVIIRTTTGGTARASSDAAVQVGVPAGQQQVLSFDLNAFFVDPELRGRGVGRGLVQAVDRFVRDEMASKGLEKARISVSVNSENEAAIGLYVAQGYVRVGSSRYAVGGEDREAVEMERVLDAVN